MSEDEQHGIENLEIEPLSDEDLESVAGGMTDHDDCSMCCGNPTKSYCTSFDPGEIEDL